MNVTLLEHVATGGRVDREAGIIYGVKVLGRVSANGREYSDRALDDAARLYEGCKTCLNHDRANPRRERSILEEVGVLRNVRRNGDAVYADWHLFKGNAATPMLLDRAENHPTTFGLSHNSEGRMSRDGRVVESLSSVCTVDVVGEPATNNGLFESRSSRPRSFRELLEDRTAPALGSSPAAAVSDASSEVDDVVDASLDELIVAATIPELRDKCGQSISRAYDSAISFITGSEDPRLDKMAVLKKLIDGKQKALDTFDGIFASLPNADPIATADDDELDARDLPASSMESRNRGRFTESSHNDRSTRNVKEFVQLMR